MIGLVIWHHVRTDGVEAYLEATLANARATNLEPGAVRFDVLHDPEDPTRFALYEVYRDREAQQAHLASAHFQTWKRVAMPLIERSSVTKVAGTHVPD